MSHYFRNLSGVSNSSFAFAEDLGHAADRAQGVLSLVAETLANDPDDSCFFAVHAALRELSDMKESIEAFIDSHPDLVRESSVMEGQHELQAP
jgi:hypothetical protein